ncbi:uncharacterized protein LOC115447199 isoform X2 [Manduca sexta]|uniref:Transmembrane protein n=1 Tax=Manduca sexta TaxID=7130 RepID=A0A921ZE77_MANSE|nr:uncharacterized protein LOC115447199 isoform X2 [Manduca sexta]KAG6455905.1 hypothetical protein O3G_MSEX009460 [Manduca sexta]
MYSKFPLSMENIPRQKGFACLSLKFGCIFSALIIILYSVLALAQCTATLGGLTPTLTTEDWEGMATYGMIIAVIITHCVTLFLTAVMLAGTLREKPYLMRPWLIWTSVQVTAYILMFVFWTTMNMINQMADGSLLFYVIDFLGLLFRFYMLMLVASYYKELEEDHEYGERLKAEENDQWYNSA